MVGTMAKIDDSVKKKVPELRFKGFTDEWEQRKLGDEVRIVMGQSPNSENYTDDPNDYILVQGNADMKNGRSTPQKLVDFFQNLPQSFFVFNLFLTKNI